MCTPLQGFDGWRYLLGRAVDALNTGRAAAPITAAGVAA